MPDRAEQPGYVFKKIGSPVGELTLIGSDGGLAAVLWEIERPDRIRIRATLESSRHPVLVETEHQLGEYFAGKRRAFDLELDAAGTDFQKSVWNALRKIPYGETRSYGDIARQLGDVKAVRAVGAANGRNPIPIVVPCHRVIGASGRLVGFGGGLEAKERLLQLERGQAAFNF